MKFWLIVAAVVYFLIQNGTIHFGDTSALTGAIDFEQIKRTVFIAMAAFIGITVYSPVARDKIYAWIDSQLQPKA